MAFRRNEVIKEIKRLIEKLKKNDIFINSAYLFGSYAGNRATEESDIDVALVSRDFSGVRFYDNKRIIPYLQGFNNYIEIHPFSLKDFNRGNLFIREIKKTGIKITEK